MLSDGRSNSSLLPVYSPNLELEQQRLDWEVQTKLLASQKPMTYPDGHFYGEKRFGIFGTYGIGSQQTWHEIE
jgi:hypothetical protein